VAPAARLELARLAAADFESVRTIKHWRGLAAFFFRKDSTDSAYSALRAAVFAEAVLID